MLTQRFGCGVDNDQPGEPVIDRCGKKRVDVFFRYGVITRIEFALDGGVAITITVTTPGNQINANVRAAPAVLSCPVAIEPNAVVVLFLYIVVFQKQLNQLFEMPTFVKLGSRLPAELLKDVA